MAKSQQSFNKKEREKKKRKKKREKIEEREKRKLEKESSGKKSFEDQIRYVDEYGNLSSKPPTSPKKKVKAAEIVLGVPKKEDLPDDPIRNGKIKFFDVEKNYGFILEYDSNESIFVHGNDADFPLQENDKVSYELEKTPKGLKAVRVKKT